MSLRSEYLEQSFPEESDEEDGYDSEAAERSKSQRHGAKKRKLSHSSYSSGEEPVKTAHNGAADNAIPEYDVVAKSESQSDDDDSDVRGQEINYSREAKPSKAAKIAKSSKKQKKPGVVYLSSLPPYLKPSALRNLLAQRGFEPVTRLFLTPSSKHKHNSKKSSRQLYTEGWIEFASKKTAKRCAEALNAQLVGGRKGGFYHDDLWNMKYLKGMAWDELMAGIREERREEEGRRDEERRKIAAETRAYIEGVEKGKQIDGIKRKRSAKGSGNTGQDDVQRTWRQHEVAADRKKKSDTSKLLDPEVQQVLSKII